MSKLSNKIILITGGTTGIGLATAQLLASEEAHVVVTGNNPETIEQAKAMLGNSVEVYQSDTADLASIESLFATLKKQHGRLDGLFVNAGIAQFAPIEAVSPEFFDWLFSINVRGAYFTIKSAIPLIPDGGAIALNSSVAAVAGMPAASVYGATKAALSSIGRSLSVELAPRIRVNTISPGPITTPIYAKTQLPPEMVESLGRQMANGLPLKRFGTADEVAQAALFLLSSDSSFITGVELFVAGGQQVPIPPVDLSK